MKITNDERIILNIIKFSPIILVIFVSLFISNIYLTKMEEDFTREVESTKQKYLIQNQENVKNKIENIYNLISYEKEKSEQALKSDIKKRVYQVHNTAMNIYNKNKNKKTKEEIIFDIKTAIETSRFNDGRGYFFIYDLKGTNILHPIKPQREGKNFFYVKDTKGTNIVQESINIATSKEKEGFQKWFFHKPKDSSKEFEKIGFIKQFEPYNWFIGTAEYIDDFENDLKKELLLKIKNITRENKNYIFIFDDKGNVLSHYKDSLIGTNRYNIKNPLGKYVVKDIIEFAQKSKKGFMSYSTEVNPENLKKRKKISYIRLINNWKWIIGTGFFLENFEKEIEQKTKYLLESKQKSINKIIILSISITLVFILLSFYISNKVSEKFVIYRNKIQDETNKTIEKQRLLIQQSKMAAMGEMIGNIAHQWRQPLSTISTVATGAKVQKEMDCLSDMQFNSAMDKINSSAQYLSETIDDFRNFFNPNNNKKIAFEISNTINKALTLVNAQFTSKNIELIQNVENNELFSLENELVQVLINILNNARDALILKDNQRRLIFINSYKKDDTLYIEIIDNAGGIKEDIIDRIFEPYFTTKHKLVGTGIGLYMSEEIVLKHLEGNLCVSNKKYTYEGIEYTGAKFIINI